MRTKEAEVCSSGDETKTVTAVIHVVDRITATLVGL